MTACTAYALVKMTQSNFFHLANSASSKAKFSGGANETRGSKTGMAPRAVSVSYSSELCKAARVITTRLPVKDDRRISATLTAHFLKNTLRARVDQQTSQVLAQSGSLLRRRGGALLHIL